MNKEKTTVNSAGKNDLEIPCNHLKEIIVGLWAEKTINKIRESWKNKKQPGINFKKGDIITEVLIHGQNKKRANKIIMHIEDVCVLGEVVKTVYLAPEKNPYKLFDILPYSSIIKYYKIKHK